MINTPDNWSVAHESFHIFECIPPWVQWQAELRSQAGISREIKAGMNFSIILASACYIEGNFERVMLKAINAADTPQAPLQSRLMSELRLRLSKTTGNEGYNEMFGIVFGKKANELIADPELWETIKILFFFRNVIAHGRAVGYKLYFPPGVGGFWEEEFSGGYKKVEEFLFKKDLLQSRHIEEADNWHYFSDAVADFFWAAAQTFTNKLNEVPLPISSAG
jgi:hypothetical protein